MSAPLQVATAVEAISFSSQPTIRTTPTRLLVTHSPTCRPSVAKVYQVDKPVSPLLKSTASVNLQEVVKNQVAWARYNSYLEVQRKKAEGQLLSSLQSTNRKNSSHHIGLHSPVLKPLQTSIIHNLTKPSFNIQVSEEVKHVVRVNSETAFGWSIGKSGNRNTERKQILRNLSPAHGKSPCALHRFVKSESRAKNKQNSLPVYHLPSEAKLHPAPDPLRKFPLFHELLRSSKSTLYISTPDPREEISTPDPREEIRKDILRKLNIELHEDIDFKGKMNIGEKRHHHGGYQADQQAAAGGSSAKRRRSGPGQPSYQAGYNQGRGGSQAGHQGGQGPSNRPLPVATMQMATEYILRMYDQKKQTAESFQRKMELRSALFSHVQSVFPGAGLYIVGSSMNGFGTVHSDMDMCLMLAPNMVINKKQCVQLLRKLEKKLRKWGCLKEMLVIAAKVPILKFKDRVSGTECDININNEDGIRNTHLLNAYAKVDKRVKPLVLFVKVWAKYHNINDASQSTLSSYSLTCLVIHYLQCACDPPVLPSLQRKFPNVFAGDQDVRTLSLNQQLPEFNSPNSQSLGELFVGFLQYSINLFDQGDVISIRTAGKISKDVAQCHSLAEGGDQRQWKFVNIEEPFNLSNVSKSVYDQYQFARICRVFRASLARFRMTGKLESLLDHPI